jgi:hypothetical protein
MICTLHQILLLLVFLLGLHFHPENVGDMFHQNAGWLSTRYTALHSGEYVQLFIFISMRTTNLTFCH